MKIVVCCGLLFGVNGCLLLDDRCEVSLFRAVCCSLFVVFVLFVVYGCCSSLVVLRCSLSVVRCSWLVVHCCLLCDVYGLLLFAVY